MFVESYIYPVLLETYVGENHMLGVISD